MYTYMYIVTVAYKDILIFLNSQNAVVLLHMLDCSHTRFALE